MIVSVIAKVGGGVKISRKWWTNEGVEGLIRGSKASAVMEFRSICSQMKLFPE